MEVDFSQLDFATATKLDEILRTGYDATLVEAGKRQARVALLTRLQRPLAKDGFGEMTFLIDPVFDAHWRECYGKDYKDDKALMKFLLKRNPEIGVKSRGTKEIMVGYTPSSGSKRPVGLTVKERAFA